MYALSQRRRATTVALVALLAVLARGTAAAQPALPNTTLRVGLVPLDDRPACLQWPIQLGEVADTEVIVPPRGVLGRFHKTGDGDAIARWLDGLDLSTLDALVVSTDMLAYGGLTGSRVPRVFEADAMRRLDALARLKQRQPDLRVYAFSTILPAAPAAEADQGAWQKTRERNRAVNLSLVDRTAAGAIDFLVFGYDRAASGATGEDRGAIADAIRAARQADRIVTQPGADHLAALLLARAVATRLATQPVVQVVYSSAPPPEAAALIAGQVAAAGARLAERSALQLFVYVSRHDSPDLADVFASRVAKAMTSGGRVVLADLDVTGGAEGAWLPMVEALRTRKLLTRLFSYASSNTPEATVGAALAHGLLFALAVERIAPSAPAAGLRVASAQVKVLLHRLVNDFLYEGVVRGQASEDFVRSRNLNQHRLDEGGRVRVEKHLVGELKPLAESLAADFTAQPWRLPAPAGGRSRVALTVKDIERFEVSLPWGRMLEAEIRFGLVAQPLTATPRPPTPRVLK